ncbi:unnamed protein product [Arabidopsis arenosa]|uniref:TIR domain-containing protein n=1 Tax=Arabidopsis arenosa TaxID=38785 RepID=A0A8S2B385_ARAAE|nr:unnamed protein product [Arabidopsis arenosa]
MAMEARPQVFINHGGNDLSDYFVRELATALRDQGFNVFIGSDERGARRGIKYIFRAIESSDVALVIFSDMYAASEWCLHEAVRIYDRHREGKLVLVPIYYRVSKEDVNMFQGRFGECFVKTLKTRGINGHPFADIWKTNVNLICTEPGFTSKDFCNIDVIFMVAMVHWVKRRLRSRNLPSDIDMFIPKQLEAQEGFGKELLYVSIAALLALLFHNFFGFH